MRLLAAKWPASRSGIADTKVGISNKLKTKTFLAAEAQSTQRKSLVFPLRTLRLATKLFFVFASSTVRGFLEVPFLKTKTAQLLAMNFVTLSRSFPSFIF